MKYTEYGLQISLDELEELLDAAKIAAEHRDMEHSIYIKGGDKPKITQYCCYAECNPINYTCSVKEEA